MNELKVSFKKTMDQRRNLTRTALRKKVFEQLGIKNAHNLNVKQLCEHLQIPLLRNYKFDRYHKKFIKHPVKIIFTEVTERPEKKELEFKSIYNTAASLGKSVGCIPYYIKKKTVVMYNGRKWCVSRKYEKKKHLNKE